MITIRRIGTASPDEAVETFRRRAVGLGLSEKEDHPDVWSTEGEEVIFGLEIGESGVLTIKQGDEDAAEIIGRVCNCLGWKSVALDTGGDEVMFNQVLRRMTNIDVCLPDGLALTSKPEAVPPAAQAPTSPAPPPPKSPQESDAENLPAPAPQTDARIGDAATTPEQNPFGNDLLFNFRDFVADINLAANHPIAASLQQLETSVRNSLGMEGKSRGSIKVDGEGARVTLTMEIAK